MIEAVQEVVDLPLVLDSPNPELLALGLSVCRRRPVLNGLALDEARVREIPEQAARGRNRSGCFADG